MATKDMSILRSPIQIGVTGFLQLLQSYHVGTEEVKQALVHHCDFIMECKVCRSLFRGLPNFLAHKRHYCEDPNRNIEVSMENVRIVQSASTAANCQDDVYTNESDKRQESSPESVFFNSFLSDGNAGSLPTNQPDIEEGTLPIPCHGVCGFSSFLIHHGFVNKSGRGCSLCKFSTPDVKRMHLHVQMEHLKKVSLYQCSHCPKVYSKSASLQSHLILEHSMASSEAAKIASSRKTKVEKFVINGKVYNPPLNKPQGEFKDVSRKIVLKIFDSLDVLEFTDRDQSRALCKLHQGENLDGFQNIRRHLVDYHLKSNNVCMFCSHSNSSFGHVVKHMVLAHDLTIDKIDGMKDKIRQHFCKASSRQCSVTESSQDEEMLVHDQLQVDVLPVNHKASDHSTKPEHSDNIRALKREHGRVMKNDLTQPAKKRRKAEFDLRHPIKPVSASGTRTWLSFLRHNKFFLSNGKCRYCDAVMKSRRSQGKHLLNKHLKRQTLYQCKKCGLVFQEEHAFESHVISLHSMTAKNLSEFKVQKFVLHNGRVFDIPAKLEAAPVDTPASSSPRTVSEPTKSTDSCSVSSNVLYSEREMLLAIITCMYIIKFKDAGCQVVQCVHHSEVALPSFSHVIEHLVSNHIKEDYTCFMCPFRRKDANSLVKHMASSHHMSVDRIQRLKEKIKVNLNISKLTDSKKLNFASVCLRATDQIIAVLNSSRDGRGSESLVDDSNILKESSALDKLQLSPEVKSPKCFFSSRDLVLALIDCLGVLKFHARPKTYQPNSNYVAECLVHRSEQMDGLQNIIHHVTAEHLRVTYGCFLCGVLAHSLEYLAEHLIRMHGLDVRKILSMKDVIRSSLLKKGSITDSAIRESAHTAGSRSSGMTSAAVMRGIPCPRCGKKCTTFKRITKHLTESHLVRPLLATRLVERLRTRMQRKEQKCKAEQMEVANKLVQTKSGRIIRKISEVNSDGDATKDSMFGLEDIKCMICGRSYPTTWSALAHITKVHKKTTKEGRKYISQPALSLKPVTHYHNAETMKPDDNCKEDKADASHRLRRSVNKSDDTDRSSTVSLFGADDLPCKICLKSFPKRAGLVDHYMRHHNMSRGEVYDLLQHLNTRKKAANSKSQTTEPQAENKRKQSSPRKCESNAITQKSSSDDSTSDMSLEGSHNKTLKTEEESLKMDSSPTGGPSFLQENNHSKKSSNSKDAAVKHNKVPSTTVVNSVGEPLGSQSAIPEQTDDTLLSSETNSNQPTKALHRCVDCSKFFSGSEVVTDSRNPLCKKCQKPVTS